MTTPTKLSEITETTPLIKDFTQRLAKSVKQAIVSVVIGKIKRTSGVSALPIDINLENGQIVSIYVRLANDKPDIFRIDVNGKQMPTTGDFSNEYKPSFNKSVDEVANFILRGQSAFDANRTKMKVARISSQSESQSQKKQLDELTTKASELDQQIELKEGEKQVLQDKLATLKATAIA